MTAVTPLNAAGADLADAHLEIVEPTATGGNPVVPLRFNPAEFQLKKANNFAEISIPGLESPPLQFIRGAAESLSFEALVDTSDTLEDVREKYVDRIRSLLNIDRKLHAPPIVRFVWAREEFRGVLESLDVTYTMFDKDGTPLRAKLNLTLKEYRTVEIQVAEDRTSPDVDKTYVVRRGDTLTSIAAAAYRDVNAWREIALANDIDDPQRLEPGRLLRLPRLR